MMTHSNALRIVLPRNTTDEDYMSPAIYLVPASTSSPSTRSPFNDGWLLKGSQGYDLSYIVMETCHNLGTMQIIYITIHVIKKTEYSLGKYFILSSVIKSIGMT